MANLPVPSVSDTDRVSRQTAADKHDGTDGTPKKRIKNALGLLIKYVNCKNVVNK